MIGLYSLQKKIQERIKNVPKINELSEDFRDGDVAGSTEILADLDRVIAVLESRKKELEKEEFDNEKPPVTHCPSCKKELTVGAMGPEGTKWGCYNFDCSKVKENNYYHYTVPFSRLYMKIEELDLVLGEKE